MVSSLIRRIAGLALVLAVLLVHIGVTETLSQRMSELNARVPMPPRIEVAYVREMELAKPVSSALPVSPPPRRPVSVAAPASAPRSGAKLERPRYPLPPSVIVANPVPDPVTEPASAPEGSVETAIAVSAPASAADSAAPAFEWPASTRLSYVLTGHYRGAVDGAAQVEWIHQGPHYQVHLDVRIGLSFAPLMSRRMSSEGRITPDGLVPARYDEETKMVFRKSNRVTMMFDRDSVWQPGRGRRENWPGVQDTASQFVQLSWLLNIRPELLRVGGTVEVPLALQNYTDVWIYDVVQEEILVTPFGGLDTWHLKPRRPVRAAQDLVAEIWFAPQLRYLPARILIHQDAETFIDLRIAKRPELAAPE